MGPQWDGRVTEPGTWSLWYFGADYARFLALTSALGTGHSVVSVGDVINKVAARLRTKLLEFDEWLASGSFQLAWASSDLAERNPLSSDFYLDLCRSVGLVEAARAGGRHLVVVDDAGLGKTLAKLCRRAGIKARRHIRGGTQLVQAIRAHGGFLRDWLKQRRALKRHGADPAKLAGRATLLMSWVEGGEWQLQSADRFLGNLSVWLRDDGQRLGWLGNPTTWITPIDDIAAAAQRASVIEPIVLVGALQGIAALLRAYVCLFAFPLATRRRFIFAGINLSSVVRRYVLRELMSPRLVFAALYYSIAGALKRRGIAPAVLIYTYENQPWEKAMLIGFRRASPRTLLIGVQHAPFADNYLSAHPPKSQWRDGTAPDLLVTIGEEFRARLLALGSPTERIVVGGALRFPDLSTTQRTRRGRVAGESLRILASCPMDPREALELTHKAAVATAGLAGLRLFVNFHPMLEQTLRTNIRNQVVELVDTRHVEFVEGSAQQWLNQVDVLLYNSSGTSFEAAALGIPVIYVGSELTLDLDKMAGQSGMQCRNSDELRRVIQRLMSDGEARKTSVEAAQAFLRRCFTAPMPEFWTRLTRQAMNAVRA